MVGLDTNVLVRYLAQDDAVQSAIANRLIDTELTPTSPGFISLIVLVETCWVLKRLYAATDIELAQTVESLLQTGQFQLEQRDVVQTTVTQWFARTGSKAGLTDWLVCEVARKQGCTHTVSFDKLAVRSAGMELLS